MKTKIILLIANLVLMSCSVMNNKKAENIKYRDLDLSAIDTNDFLIVKSQDVSGYETGSPFAFVNRKGDTVIPPGRYYATWTDTLKTFAIVSDKNLGLIGIDKEGNVLYKVFSFDNGPDFINEGLFRVVRYGKIGYADRRGKIVIPCQFDCAYYFENGKAKVSKNCKKIKDFDHVKWESDSWYFIDKTGKKTE